METSVVSDIPAGDGKVANLFFTLYVLCVLDKASKILVEVELCSEFKLNARSELRKLFQQSLERLGSTGMV
jgi:hypothetical protein